MDHAEPAGAEPAMDQAPEATSAHTVPLGLPICPETEVSRCRATRLAVLASVLSQCLLAGPAAENVTLSSLGWREVWGQHQAGRGVPVTKGAAGPGAGSWGNRCGGLGTRSQGWDGGEGSMTRSGRLEASSQPLIIEAVSGPAQSRSNPLSAQAQGTPWRPEASQPPTQCGLPGPPALLPLISVLLAQQVPTPGPLHWRHPPLEAPGFPSSPA